MKKIAVLVWLTLYALVLVSGPASPEDSKYTQIKKQPEIQQIKPKKPVKIKLKRSAEGKYTWELSGDNVDEIVRADKRLRKLLGAE